MLASMNTELFIIHSILLSDGSGLTTIVAMPDDDCVRDRMIVDSYYREDLVSSWLFLV